MFETLRSYAYIYRVTEPPEAAPSRQVRRSGVEQENYTIVAQALLGTLNISSNACTATLPVCSHERKRSFPLTVGK